MKVQVFPRSRKHHLKEELSRNPKELEKNLNMFMLYT